MRHLAFQCLRIDTEKAHQAHRVHVPIDAAHQFYLATFHVPSQKQKHEQPAWHDRFYGRFLSLGHDKMPQPSADNIAVAMPGSSPSPSAA